MTSAGMPIYIHIVFYSVCKKAFIAPSDAGIYKFVLNWRGAYEKTDARLCKQPRIGLIFPLLF